MDVLVYEDGYPETLRLHAVRISKMDTEIVSGKFMYITILIEGSASRTKNGKRDGIRNERARGVPRKMSITIDAALHRVRLISPIYPVQGPAHSAATMP